MINLLQHIFIVSYQIIIFLMILVLCIGIASGLAIIVDAILPYIREE